MDEMKQRCQGGPRKEHRRRRKLWALALVQIICCRTYVSSAHAKTDVLYSLSAKKVMATTSKPGRTIGQ